MYIVFKWTQNSHILQFQNQKKKNFPNKKCSIADDVQKEKTCKTTEWKMLWFYIVCVFYSKAKGELKLNRWRCRSQATSLCRRLLVYMCVRVTSVTLSSYLRMSCWWAFCLYSVLSLLWKENNFSPTIFEAKISEFLNWIVCSLFIAFLFSFTFYIEYAS